MAEGRQEAGLHNLSPSRVWAFSEISQTSFNLHTICHTPSMTLMVISDFNPNFPNLKKKKKMGILCSKFFFSRPTALCSLAETMTSAKGSKYFHYILSAPQDEALCAGARSWPI